MYLLLLFLLPLYFFNSLQMTTTCDGYYWRDYTGTVPDDALEAGLNTRGNPTYIGQILHEKQLIPAKIDPEENKVSYEWGDREFVALINIKIFCSQHPEHFEWIQTGNGYLGELKYKHLICGGYEPLFSLYIGRKELEDELAVGKVVHIKNKTTLNTTKGGLGYQHGLFEILAYNPNNTNPVSRPRRIYNKNRMEKQCEDNTIVINVFYN